MSLLNVHEVIGWTTCANLRCLQQLTRDHVVMTTSAHLRRFCSVECIGEGQQAWTETIYENAKTDGREAMEATIARVWKTEERITWAKEMRQQMGDV